jgi:hypothetical protein
VQIRRGPATVIGERTSQPRPRAGRRGEQRSESQDTRVVAPCYPGRSTPRELLNTMARQRFDAPQRVLAEPTAFPDVPSCAGLV